jgi:short-subunit dehydrogenase
MITGATAGIGLAFARSLAAAGHDLVLNARDTQRLEQIATDLRANARVDVEILAADLSDREQCPAVETRLSDPNRPIEILINNAGFGLNETFVDAAIEDEQRLLDVLVTAVMRLTHAVVPGMLARGSGAVINVSSVAGWIPSGTYSAAKSWVTVFSESLSAELAGTGVHVTAVCPGYTHTEFHQRADMNVSEIPQWMWLDVDQVVRRALSDVRRGHAISVPGRQYKVLSALARHAPRALVRRATARTMR